jgi:hypothetical protein
MRAVSRNKTTFDCWRSVSQLHTYLTASENMRTYSTGRYVEKYEDIDVANNTLGDTLLVEHMHFRARFGTVVSDPFRSLPQILVFCAISRLIAPGA